MIDLSDCLVLGALTKTHGIRGQVILRLNNLSFEDIIKMESVFIEIDGLPVPFFIDEYSERNPESLILTIGDIYTENQAKALINKRVFVRTKTIKKTILLPNKASTYIGYIVIDEKYGELGILDEVIEIKQNPLYKILKGKREILIPVQPEFILNIDTTIKTILVNIPLGLTDLFD
jgi:16S rRNA processing protein RimM